jgi:hypothetical protein
MHAFWHDPEDDSVWLAISKSIRHLRCRFTRWFSLRDMSGEELVVRRRSRELKAAPLFALPIHALLF